jgi:DNA-binding response OmpR family regulator
MSNQIDIIIVCFQNSSKDNIHICSQLKTNTLTRDIPVIVMFSKRISVHNKLLFFKAGVNEILQIPEDSPLLHCRINNLFIHAENLKKKFSRTTYSQDFDMLDGDGEFMGKLKKVLRRNFSDPTLNTALMCITEVINYAGVHDSGAIKKLKMQVWGEIIS